MEYTFTKIKKRFLEALVGECGVVRTRIVDQREVPQVKLRFNTDIKISERHVIGWDGSSGGIRQIWEGEKVSIMREPAMDLIVAGVAEKVEI